MNKEEKREYQRLYMRKRRYGENIHTKDNHFKQIIERIPEWTKIILDSIGATKDGIKEKTIELGMITTKERKCDVQKN